MAMESTQEKPRSSFMTWKVSQRDGSEIVPLLPADLAGGSDTLATMNPMVKNALTNPFVPVGMAATVGCLIGMCKATLNRNQYRAQLYMRGRVAAQFFTVCVLVGGALWMGFRPGNFGAVPGNIPPPQDSLTKRMLNRTD